MPAHSVLLISPSNDLTRLLTPDLGIGFIASVLREEGFETDYLDVKLQNADADLIAKKVMEKDYLFVGVKVFSPFISYANDVIRAVKNAKPELKTVIGGPHPTYSFTESLATCPEADIAVIGEGETAVISIAKALQNETSLESIESICYRENGEIKTGRERKTFENLENLPIPAWDLIDPRLYRNYEDFWFFSKGDTVAAITASRGCPFKCTFCSDSIGAGKPVRYRKLDTVIDEIKRLQAYYDVDEIHIIDSLFTMNKRYAYEFCEVLLKNNIRIHWAAAYGVRLDTLDAPLLRAMEESGCYGISVGIESGSARILEFMKKGIAKEKIEEKISLIKETTNFLIQGYFIIGFPTETEETIEETLNFACKLPLDMAGFTPFRITPGTEIAEYLKANEPDATPIWKNQTVEKVDYAPKGLNPNDMKILRRKAYRRFYLRPHIIWKYLKMLRGKKQFSIMANKIKTRLLTLP